MRVLTWNINSVRLRLPLLLKLMEQQRPDVVCLQETKCPDDKFPFTEIITAGYAYTHIHGMKSYNGVAVLSKVPFTTTEIHHRVGREDCRHVAVQLPAFELHNLYIPAGGDEPDPEINDKYVHKLNFVDEMTGWFRKTYKESTPLIALGDFNIAPMENDVWSHRQLLNVVSHTEPEVTRLNKMKASLDWVDTARHFIPEEEKAYTWWSYRNRDWKKSNRGRRLDHIWLTKPLLPSLKSYAALTEAREWEKPSDHVPVMVDLDV